MAKNRYCIKPGCRIFLLLFRAAASSMANSLFFKHQAALEIA